MVEKRSMFLNSTEVPIETLTIWSGDGCNDKAEEIRCKGYRLLCREAIATHRLRVLWKQNWRTAAGILSSVCKLVGIVFCLVWFGVFVCLFVLTKEINGLAGHHISYAYTSPRQKIKNEKAFIPIQNVKPGVLNWNGIVFKMFIKMLHFFFQN